MSQTASPDRPVTIGSKTYTLRFSFIALAALQDHWQLKTLDDVMLKLASGPNTLDDVQAILHAGLRTHHSDIGFDDCLKLLDDAGPIGMIDVMRGAFGASMPSAEGAAPKGASGPTKPGRSTGSSKRPRR